MEKELNLYILNVVMSTIGKAINYTSFRGGKWTDEEVQEAIKNLADGGYLLAKEFSSETSGESVILVNNVTEKGLKLHEELRK